MASLNKHVKVTGDSKSYQQAMRQAAFEANKVAAAQRNAAREAAKQAASTDTLKSKYNKLRLTYDTTYAAQMRYQNASKTIKKVADAEAWSQERLQVELQKLAAHYGLAETQAGVFNRQIRASRFHSANLAAQFNDIGVMMASGQSPFILAMQQGTQVSQVLNSMGGSIRQQGKALTTAFLSVLNPTSLLTIGLIGLTAAGVQWAQQAWFGKENTDQFGESLKRLTENTEEAQTKLRLMHSSFSSAEQLAAADRLIELTQEELALKAQISRLDVSVNSALQFYLNRLRGKLEAIQEEKALVQETLDTNIAANRELEKQEESAQRLRDSWKVGSAQQKEIWQAMMKSRQEAARITGIASMQAKYTQEQRNAAAKSHAEFVKIFETTKKMKEKLGEANYEALRLSGIDMQSPITLAAIAAGNLSANMKAALASALGLANLSTTYDMMEGSDGAQRLRKYGGRGTVTDNDPTYGDTGKSIYDVNTGGGGGGAKTDKFATELEALREKLATEVELELQQYEQRQEILTEALEKKYITQQEYQQMMERAQKQHSDKMVSLQQWQYMDGLQKTGAYFGLMADAFAGGTEKMQRISQAFAASEALINAWRAYNQTLADPSLPFFAKFAAAVKVLTAGIGAVNAIKGVGSGGSGSTSPAAAGGTAVPSAPAASEGQSVSRNVSIQLQGNIFSRDAVIDLINEINEAVEDGATVRLV